MYDVILTATLAFSFVVSIVQAAGYRDGFYRVVGAFFAILYAYLLLGG